MTDKAQRVVFESHELQCRLDLTLEEFKGMGAGGFGIFVGTIVVVTVVTLEEVTQLWIYTRRFGVIDLIAGYLGIATADIALRRKSVLGKSRI